MRLAGQPATSAQHTLRQTPASGYATATRAQVPRAEAFDDFGGVALGRLGRWLVYCTVYLTIFTEPIVFHLTRRTRRLRCPLLTCSLLIIC